MNVIRELANFFRQQAGIIFASQASDPVLPLGVVALWHNSTDDRLRFRNAAGATVDLDAGAPLTALKHRFVIPAGPTGSVDFVLFYREEIVDVVLHKTGATGGGAGTLQLINAAGGAPITDAMSINVDPGRIVRPALIDNAQNVIAAGMVLRFQRTRTASTDESVVAYVTTLHRS